MLQFNVNAPPGTSVTINVGSKTVIENQGNFSNDPFTPLPDGYQTKIADQSGTATFQVNITGKPGYVQIMTPGLDPRPTVLTGPVGPGSSLQPCKYRCRQDKSYGGPKTPISSGISGGGGLQIFPTSGKSKGTLHAPKLGRRK